MTESDLARKMMRVFEDLRNKFLIFKHSDRFTKGIPDISITGVEQTWWLELKVLNRILELGLKTQFDKRVKEDLVQFMTMRRLDKFSGERAFYLTFGLDTQLFYTANPEIFMENYKGLEVIQTFPTIITALEGAMHIRFFEEEE